MRDPNGLVEYKSFMGTLFTKAQQHRQQAQQAPRASPRVAAPPTCHLNSTQAQERLPKAGRQAAAAAAAAVAAAAAEPIALPNWAAARQRRWVSECGAGAAWQQGLVVWLGVDASQHPCCAVLRCMQQRAPRLRHLHPLLSRMFLTKGPGFGP